MRQDIAAHKEQTAHKSYLGYAVSAVTSFGRNDTFAPVEHLNDQLQNAVKKGDTAAADKLASEVKGVVDADKKSMSTDQLINQYGTGMIKTAGLFVPGKPGYALSALAYSADQARPGDSASNQVIDGALGFGKGLGLKSTFDYVGAQNIPIAFKAVSLGVSTRVVDNAMTRQTYAEGDGYSAEAGISRTLAQSFNKTALVSDVVTFGVAHGALSGINGITGGALRNSPFLSTIATGGVFGLSSGSVQEINRQRDAGEKFDIQKVLTTAALTGVTDMIAAAPGAKMISNRATAPGDLAITTTPSTSELASGKLEPSKLNTVIHRNLGESHSREFQLVNTDQRVIEQLRAAPNDPVYAAVREMLSSGELGPSKNMIIQHLELYPDSASVVGLNATRAAKVQSFNAAELLATCNPEALPPELRAKHIMPSAEGVYVTQDQTGRLRFTDAEPTQLRQGESQPVKLDHTVSELLLSRGTPQYIENTHDKTVIAQAMRHFKTPVRYFNAGVDNIAFELPDKSILKITDHGWDPSWGSREVRTAKGMKLADARILRKPTTIDLDDTSITYFVQKRLLNPVTAEELRAFDRMIKADGTYKFWDNDFKEHGRKQVGVDPDTGELYLIDYDAMRLPHLVPKFERESQDSLIDRILDRYND